MVMCNRIICAFVEVKFNWGLEMPRVERACIYIRYEELKGGIVLSI